jgi:hypothetical protein
MGWFRSLPFAGAIGLALVACTGNITDPGPGSGQGPGSPTGTGTEASPTGNPPPGVDPTALDPGYLGAHRLNNTQYNHVVQDLLGTALSPADFFQAATVTGFDTNAQALSRLTPVDAQAYFGAALDLVNDVFQNPTLTARILTCQPAAAGDTACAKTIIESFGKRAFRRPVAADESEHLLSVYSSAMTTLGKDHAGAIAHTVRVMLTSAPFLYRVRAAQSAAGTQPLNPYDLASTLSFMLWSSQPDDALLARADAAELSDLGVLDAEVDRLLADARAERFIETFFDQWLAVRELAGHAVDVEAYPAWSPELRSAMTLQAHDFFSGFIASDRPWVEFLSAELPAAPGLSSVLAADPAGFRSGFLGLPAFLTAKSLPTRTAPTFRGKIVLDALLCTVIELPDGDIPELEEAMAAGGDPTNIRDKLEAHRQSPACIGCHQLLDPIGLGLENYDAIGGYRTTYEGGQPIDASGAIDTQQFNGPSELAAILSQDPRFTRCIGDQLMSFALGRILRTEDQPYGDQLTQNWNGGGLTLLVKELVKSDVFRFQKPPAP